MSNSKKALVTVIIPNYNHSQFLQKRIESVLHQSFQDFELILIDDCSSDNSKTIIEDYRDHPKVSKILYNEKNSGSVFKQWIKAIELSKGKYTWIAESDDVAHLDFLKETVNLAEQQKEFGLVFTASKVIDQNGELQNRFLQPSYLQDGFSLHSKKDIADYLIADMIIRNASSVLFSTQHLRSIDKSELVKFKNTGDRYVYSKIGLQAPIYYIDKALNYYRSHGENTTAKNRENKTIYRDHLYNILYHISLISL